MAGAGVSWPNPASFNYARDDGNTGHISKDEKQLVSRGVVHEVEVGVQRHIH